MFQDVIVTIDTREQNAKRIGAVKDFFTQHGAYVLHEKLEFCDYRIEGTFNEKNINIGIEAKSITDFSSSYTELSDKLSRAYQYYERVGLFVETGEIRYNHTDFKILNDAKLDGSADILSYLTYKKTLHSFISSGIFVAEMYKPEDFPYNMLWVMQYVTKDIHTGLYLREDTLFYNQLLNVLAKFPRIGYNRAAALAARFPNMFWLCSASQESLQEVIGPLIGKMLYSFIRNEELINDEWRLHHNIDPKASQSSCKGVSPQMDISPIAADPGSTANSIDTIPLPGGEVSSFSSPSQSSPGRGSKDSSVPGADTQQPEPNFSKKNSLESTTVNIAVPANFIYKDPTDGLFGDSGKPAEYRTCRIAQPDLQCDKYIQEGCAGCSDYIVGQEFPSTTTNLSPHCTGVKIPPAPTPDFTKKLPTEDKVPKDKRSTISLHLQEWFREAHTLRETTDAYYPNWSKDTIVKHILAAAKRGDLIKITDPNTGAVSYRRS